MGVLFSNPGEIKYLHNHQFLFMTGYAKAPNFVLQWFTTSALTGIASLCAGIWLFGDRVSLAAMGGVVLVFGGLGLMRL